VIKTTTLNLPVQYEVTFMTLRSEVNSIMTLTTWLSNFNWQHQLSTVSLKLLPENKFEQETRCRFFREKSLAELHARESSRSGSILRSYYHSHRQEYRQILSVMYSTRFPTPTLFGGYQVNERALSRNNNTVKLNFWHTWLWPFNLSVSLIFWQFWHSKKESVRDQTQFWSAIIQLQLLRLHKQLTLLWSHDDGECSTSGLHSYTNFLEVEK